ncbi:MAG TPA: HAMP domain-containing histidine kinase, partial [Gammaproteobacteria bacterium]|nr:HAMP domain-containing histidine kinase [Gammaproteobacteria bacterium]
MFNSLYTKLVLVLFILFIVIGGIFLAAALYTAPMYQQEVSQQLNRDLAMYIVREHVLIENGSVRHDNLEALFQKAMIINPSLELYLLDERGDVMAHSMPVEKVKRKHVSLEPINNFLSGTPEGLILGDDPSNVSQHKSFSVAPIDFDGKRQGYIYAILGSEKFDHITEILQRSLIMKWSAESIFAALIFAFAAALILFFFLMRKLRVLNHSMQRFKENEFQNEVTLIRSKDTPGDEIDNMTQTFQEMARHIHSQMNQLQETDSLRRELVANVSHDLRTPLASLSGYIETLLLKSSALSEEEKKNYLQIAFENSKRLSTLVEELFELAKLDANEIQPQYESFSLAELSYDVSHKFRLRATEKRITLDIDVDEAIPYVDADVGMIERVLDNLIDNSFKHTPEGGCIRLQLSSASKTVRVAVSDTGYGIDEKEIPHIFKRFYKKADAKAGLGLGLAIAARIIELHGDSLSVDSVLHQGTTFRF